MKQSYCLDTNVLMALVRGKELGTRIDRRFDLKSAAYFHTISVVTHGELYVLSDRHGWGEGKVQTLDNVLSHFVTVDISGRPIIEAYRRVEEANANVAGGHRNMGKNDIWIAATAIASQLPLLTTDKDFDHLPVSLIDVRYVSPQI
jgi:tRNA(fMet)-specific endonuclease VapC